MNEDFTIILLNARSMIPKLQSLICTMDELDVDVACVTETWLSDEGKEKLQDTSSRTEYDFITRVRGASRRGAYDDDSV